MPVPEQARALCRDVSTTLPGIMTADIKSGPGIPPFGEPVSDVLPQTRARTSNDWAKASHQGNTTSSCTL